jgi:uncharacterized membrane protein
VTYERRAGIAFALFCAVMSALAVARWNLWSYGTDTGIFAQSILNAPQGFTNGPEDGTHLRFHWAPIIGVLYPLVALTHSPLSIQLAQVVLIALCGPALYALIRPYASERTAYRCALLALVYPPLASLAFEEFHEIAFYPALAIGTLWALDRERWGWFALLAAAGLFVREETCFATCALGAIVLGISLRPLGSERAGLLFGAPRDRRATALAGIALVAGGAASLGIYYGLVIPHVGAWKPARFYDYPFANGPLALLAALATRPWLLGGFLTFGRGTYMLEALAPLAFLPLRSWWSVLAVPGLLVIMLSSDDVTRHMGGHYAGVWGPWFLVGMAAALARIERAGGEAAAAFPARFALRVCALVYVAFNPMHPFHYLQPAHAREQAESALRTIPPDARVLMHDEWFARHSLVFRNATTYPWTPFTIAVFARDYPNDHFRNVVLPEFEVSARKGALARSYAERSIVVYRVVKGRDLAFGER